MKLTMEQILDINGIGGGHYEYRSNVLQAMSEYAKQDAILFAQWCSKKNIYPNEYAYTLYKSQK